MMMREASYDLERFERSELDPAAFRHIDHLEAAYAMLSKYDFVEACTRYSAAIRSMAESAGAADKFNATITIAFMSIVAERRARSGDAGWHAFIASNPDLMDRNVLGAWYSRDRLGSETARRQFLLPDRVGSTHGDGVSA